MTLGRLLPVNGDIKKRDGQRREKNPKEKKKDYLLHLCVYDYQPCFYWIKKWI